MSAPSRSASCLTASLREPFEFEAPVNSPEFSLSASSARPLPPAPPPIHQAKPSPIVASRLPRSFRQCFPSIVAKLLPRPTKPNPFCRASPSHSLSFSLFSFYLSTNPYAHPSPLYSSSLRFPFRAQRLLAVTASTFVPSLFHSNRLIVSVSLTQPRIVNHRGPSFLRRTHARIHTYPIDQTLSSLSFKLLLPPPLRCSTVRSIARPAHTVILFHYFLIERLLLVLFDCSFYILQRRSYSTVSFSHVHLGIFPSLPFRTFSGVVFLRECARLACISVFVKLDVARHQVRCFVREAFEDLAGFAVGIEIKPTGFHD